MLLGYSPRYGGLLYIINVLKFFLVMNAKEFLGGLLEENKPQVCLLYTSDAADEEDSVDLGGRRNIKQKKKR